ncbi:MAG: 30S ribosomal protein S20 [Thiotrichales bacterium]|jgi:small subunit ribosomal protein S20|nr:30S ribosomal protein S20 [Pseudomonadota bacterium]MCI4411805.1 30S ribosomal protein S20 [Thiotrichales bacterium]
MANIVSAKKRVEIAERNRLSNVAQKSKTKTLIRRTLEAVATGDHAAAMAAFRKAQAQIDTIARKNIIHANKAARTKSRLNARVKAMVASA